MMRDTENFTKQFTIDEANAMLPLVRAIVSDLVDLATDVAERRQRLDYLLEGRDFADKDPYSEELALVEAELGNDSTRLEEYQKELSDLGVELKSPTEGLVDFPATIDDRDVYLCWKFDEPEVSFWHELDAGYDDRQSLTTTAG